MAIILLAVTVVLCSPSASTADQESERIAIRIERITPAPTREVSRQWQLEGREKNWSWSDDQVRISVDGNPCAGLEDCGRRLEELQKEAAHRSAAIEVGSEGENAVTYADVIMVMNECCGVSGFERWSWP